MALKEEVGDFKQELDEIMETKNIMDEKLLLF